MRLLPTNVPPSTLQSRPALSSHRHLPAIQRQRSVEASLRGAERALREIEAKLEAARAGLREASAKYTQLSALCNRIRMG